MTVNSMHPSVTGRVLPPAGPESRLAERQWPPSDSIDWQAAQKAGRACCCPAHPAVIVVMPSSPGRPHQTDLLLCGHHYRWSRARLAAAGATVLDMNGAPVTDNAWSSVPVSERAGSTSVSELESTV